MFFLLFNYGNHIFRTIFYDKKRPNKLYDIKYKHVMTLPLFYETNMYKKIILSQYYDYICYLKNWYILSASLQLESIVITFN